jgi:hypothetical protein
VVAVSFPRRQPLAAPVHPRAAEEFAERIEQAVLLAGDGRE